jgi:hypothetical protein
VLKRPDSVYVDPDDSPEIELSSRFYKAHGQVEITHTVRTGACGGDVTLIALRFCDGGEDLILRDERELRVTEIEIAAEDVPATFDRLSHRYPGVRWMREPFATPDGSVGVVEVPGQVVLLLLGKIAA